MFFFQFQGEKNYVCPVCSKAFSQNHVMRSHVAKEHPDHVLPPKGTILNIKALARIAQETENDAKLLKIN
jgi:uncharacterized C2H2 Zn-finger protein